MVVFNLKLSIVIWYAEITAYYMQSSMNCFDVSPFIINSDNVAASTPILLWADSKWIINTIQKIPILHDFFWSTSALIQ